MMYSMGSRYDRGGSWAAREGVTCVDGGFRGGLSGSENGGRSGEDEESRLSMSSAAASCWSALPSSGWALSPLFGPMREGLIPRLLRYSAVMSPMLTAMEDELSAGPVASRALGGFSDAGRGDEGRCLVVELVGDDEGGTKEGTKGAGAVAEDFDK
jgi:hypothetical protein